MSSSNRKRKNDSGESASYDEDSENRKQRKTNGGDVAQHRYANDAGSYQTGSSSASCKYPNCMVCNKGLPSHFNTQSPTWADILQVVLYALGVSHPQKEFFSLGKEIYDYIDVHWDKLSAKPRSSTWKQTAKMTLAHSRYANLFENGYDIFMKTGFWRLKKQSNPYEPSSVSAAIRPSHDTTDRAEELPSDESDHELRTDRSWESNGSKLNSPPAYKINYLLAENNGSQQPSIPNLTAYNPAVQMPPPPLAPQFYNAYNSFQKPQMSSPPSQFNTIKPNDFISQAPNPTFYPVGNAAAGQNIPPLPHAFFSRRFSVDEGAKTLEDLRNASNFGVAEPESGFYPQQQIRLPIGSDVNNSSINHIDNTPMHSSSELVLTTPQIKEEQQVETVVTTKQSTSATASPTQVPAAPQRRRSVQYDSTNNNFAVPESRAILRSSNPDYYVNANGAGEQYQRSISLEDELKSKNQLISKLYEELDDYKKHTENLRHTLEDRDRANKELNSVIASLQAQLQKEQESAQMYQQVAKYNEEQRIRLESVYKQMGDLMGPGRQNNRSPDQMRPYPFGTGIMNVAATPSGDVRTGGFQALNTGGKMSPDVDHLRYS